MEIQTKKVYILNRKEILNAIRKEFLHELDGSYKFSEKDISIEWWGDDRDDEDSNSGGIIARLTIDILNNS